MADALVKQLKRVREAHGVSQRNVEDCMEMARDQYRHIEKGRRKLPKLEDGLTAWVRRFEDCVDATQAERGAIFEVLRQRVVSEFSALLDDPSVQPS